MGALLESGMVGNIGLKHLRVIKEDTIKIIRRVFSKLLANDIVSVQAMNLPIGKLFYFIPKIQDRTSGGRHNQPYGFPSGQTDPNSGYTGSNLYDRFYEEDDAATSGLFDYSKGAVTAVAAAPSAFVTFSNGTPSESTAALSGSVSSAIVVLSGFATAGQGKMLGANGNIMDTEEFLASLSVTITGNTTANNGVKNFNVVTQKYGKGIVEYGQKSGTTMNKFQDICDEEGKIYLNVDFEIYDPASGFSAADFTNDLALANVVVSYNTYDTLEFEEEIGEVSFDLQSVTVSVTERKLRASWSPELAQDVSAFHNIDAEAELTALLSEQVAAEIDREILRDIRKGAAWRTKWDYNEWKYGAVSGTPFMGYTQKDWNQTLVTKINQISAQIHKTTLRGGANWVVVSSEVSAVFDDLEYFHVSNAGPEADTYNMGIEKIGSLAGRYQVYRDPYLPAGKVIIGHKGKSLLDAGYIYAPYVPLQLTPTMYNPFNFTPIKGIMTRYAKKMVNNRYYGVIDVHGLATFSLDTLR